NTRTFNASNIDGNTNTITLLAPVGAVNNPFELGQAVIYREPGRTDADKVVDSPLGYKVWQSPNPAIDGKRYVPLIGGEDGLAKGDDYFLEHGATYYVMAGVNQFNLIGDQRLVDRQVIQLGTLENETRGGIARIKLGEVNPAATGFTLSAD